MAFFDDAFGVLGAAGGGAAAGSAFGPWGAAIGGGLGLLGGIGQANTNAKARKTQAQARAEMQELARQQYAQRMQDLQAAMKYFQPVNARLERLYGSDAVAPPFKPRVG